MNTKSRSLGEELENKGVSLGTRNPENKGVSIQNRNPEYTTLFGKESVGDLKPFPTHPIFRGS